MQKYKQAAMSIAFLTLLFTAGAFAGPARQAGADNPAQARQEAILASFENDDYDAWKESVGKRNGIGEIITKDDFKAFVAARRAARSGNYDKAIAISSELEDKLKDKIADILVA
ncbi:hypothetical protein HGA34_00060 [Candidatus Falkowbacteria bacterium]|nr:hypothetical protein [Candidatus Falkowbacteria bacterium]